MRMRIFILYCAVIFVPYAQALVQFECGTYKVPGHFGPKGKIAGRGELILFQDTLSETHIPVLYEKAMVEKILGPKEKRGVGEFEVEIFDPGTAPINATLRSAAVLEDLESVHDTRAIKLLKKCDKHTKIPPTPTIDPEKEHNLPAPVAP
ncbi:MAG: hypothetical protein AABY86_04845 [Bdellovibrionota bacterium]